MNTFETQQQVRFGHVDPAGIAYFPRIFDYIHEAFEELFEIHVGVRYYRMLLDDKIGFPLVHSDVDFKSALRFGDRPIVRVSCFHLGRSSLGLRYLYRLGDRMCLDARMTTACVNVETMDTMPIPDDYRERFEMIREDS